MVVSAWIGLYTLAAAADQKPAMKSRDSSPVLLVMTPCLSAEPYSGWSALLTEEGYSLHTLRSGSEDSPEKFSQAIRSAVEELAAGGELSLLAHGLGGVFLLPHLDEARRSVLVGTPLSDAWTTLPESSQRWPDPDIDWESAPCSPEMKAELSSWRQHIPPYPAPAQPVLLMTSTMDSVAPPERVRLPSADWPQRSWRRAGLLGLAAQEPGHAELLSDPVIARSVLRYLEAP